MKPLVSIIIPVFNTAKYLKHCINSLKLIDFKSYEVIFIDNNSSDGSYEILKKIKNINFRVYRNKRNFGQSFSLNKGIKLSKSSLIAIMDADDICLPNRIKDSYEFLKKNKNISLVAGMSDTIDKNGRILKRRRFTINNDFIRARIFFDNPISHTTIMVRKEILKKFGGYSLKLNYTQDYDLFSKIILNNYKIRILKKKFTQVRKHYDQQSYKNLKKQTNERIKISLRNIKTKLRVDNDILAFMKFVIKNKSKKFESKSSHDQIIILNKFLKEAFENVELRLYFLTLLFSRKNKFKKNLQIKMIFSYILKSKIYKLDKEIFLRLLKSILNIIF